MPELKPQVVHPFVTATFDIETTGLEASYGRLLCCCIKLSNEAKIHTIRCRKLSQERSALKQIRDILTSADILVGWNSIRFDVAFINARLWQRKMKTLPTKWHIDLMYQCAKLRTRGNSLDGAARDAKLPVMKHNVSAWEWVEAGQGEGPPSEESFNEIVKHCEHDVLMTEQMLFEYKPMIASIQRKG